MCVCMPADFVRVDGPMPPAQGRQSAETRQSSVWLAVVTLGPLQHRCGGHEWFRRGIKRAGGYGVQVRKGAGES